jgi:alkylation response protein AidB-like acyl-CoA dehydrogenase
MEFLDLDLNLSEEDIALKKSTHKFAREVMRPIAKRLDEMSPREVIAPESPFWEFMRKGYELGYHTILIPEPYGMNLTPLQQTLVLEELAWGSVGLAVALTVACFPAYMSCLNPQGDLVDKVIAPFCACRDASLVGCWGVTEPDHGSDTLMTNHPVFHDPSIKGQCRATLQGDQWVINGQKASWVSCGTVATHCALFCAIDATMGLSGGGIAIVPLNLPGVSKGEPLNKLGQRDLNQGEIFFDNVRIPKSYMLVGPDLYEAMVERTLATTTALMGMLGTGIARAALEESLAYAKERVQGGKPLIDHPNIQMKLFRMFQQVEVSRQISRAAFVYNRTAEAPAEEYSIAAKLQGTQSAFDVCCDAVMLFGGNGLTKEYLIEKLFRDAKAMLIEDGSNETLAIAGGHKLIQTYPRTAG